MKMPSQCFHRHPLHHSLQHARHLLRIGGADGIAEGNFITARAMQQLRKPGHFRGLYRSIIGAFGDAGNVAAQPHPLWRLGLERRDHLVHTLHSTRERNICIGPAKTLGGRDEHTNSPTGVAKAACKPRILGARA